MTTGALEAGVGALAQPRRRWVMALGSLAMSAGLIAVCLLVVDARQVGERLARAQPLWLFAFFGVYLLQLLLLGARWSLIARALGVPLGWRRACSEYALSILINVLLPTGVAGDGWRAVRHASRERSQRMPKIIEALALDRLSGQLGLLLGVLFGAPFAIEAGLVTARQGAMALGLVAAVAWIVAKWSKKSALGGGVGAALGSFVRRSASLLLHPRRGAEKHLALSILLVATHLTQLWIAARAAGVALDISLLLWLGPLISLSASVPSFFGSWGIREGASALLFAGAGLPSSAGVAVSLLVGTFSLVSALPGAVVLLADGAGRRRTREAGRAHQDGVALRRSSASRSVRSRESASTKETSGVDSAST